MIKMDETAKGWSLDCRDCVVQMIQIDFRLTLTIADARDSIRTTCEGICRMHADGNEYILDPEQTATVAPLLPLFNTAVRHITLTTDGKLVIRFAAGATFEVEPSDQCEAWEVGCLINGVGHLFVCAPGGEVAFFKGTKDRPRGVE